MTFLGTPDAGGSLYAIPGLDYVSHEDIVPYNTSDQHPIHNELFEKFFIYDSESGRSTTAADCSCEIVLLSG